MARPQQVTNEAIAEAARACFLEEGPHAPVKAVAARLGVSAAAIFARVPTKEELLLRAFFSGVPGPGRALAALQAGPKAASASAVRAELTDVLCQLMAVVRQVVPGLVMVRAAGLPWREVLARSPSTALAPDPPTALRQALTAYLTRAADGGVRCPAAPAALAEALLAPLEARAFHGHVLGDVVSSDDDAAFVRALVRGLWSVAPARRRRVSDRRMS